MKRYYYEESLFLKFNMEKKVEPKLAKKYKVRYYPTS